MKEEYDFTDARPNPYIRNLEVPIAGDISDIFDDLRVDMTGHQFDRNKANDYE